MSEIDQKLGKHIETITIIAGVKPVRSQQEITTRCNRSIILLFLVLSISEFLLFISLLHFT